MAVEMMPTLEHPLPVASGDSLVLSELWKSHFLFLWFSRGLVCPFCRRQMVQLSAIYEELKRLDFEIVQITPTDIDVARRMMKYFEVPWPYVCDVSGDVAAAFDMEPQLGPLGKVGFELKEQAKAWGVLIRHPGEPHPEVVEDVKQGGTLPSRDGGIVIVDQDGQIRFKQPTGKLSLLPSNAQILAMAKQVKEEV